MTLEHKIQSDILVAVNRHGCHLWRTNTGSVKTADGRYFSTGLPSGYPDLSGVRDSDGRAIYIEVKNERGRLREDQKRFAAMIKQYPVLYGVARSVEDALEIVNRK